MSFNRRIASAAILALKEVEVTSATRGAQPVEVNAILGFNIDTNDRY